MINPVVLIIIDVKVSNISLLKSVDNFLNRYQNLSFKVIIKLDEECKFHINNYNLSKERYLIFYKNNEEFLNKINKKFQHIYLIRKNLNKLNYKINLEQQIKSLSQKNPKYNLKNFKKDLVSILIPTHNSDKFIGRAINSILSQNYPKYEILIIDDGSTDNTIEEIRKFESSKIKLYSIWNTKSPGLLRNILIDKSEGEYVAFLDSDDYWIKNKLNKQINFMKKNKLDISCTNYKTDKDISYLNFEKKIIKFKDLLLKNFIGTSTVIIKKSLFNNFKFKNNRIGLPEDYELWLKILVTEKIGYLNETLSIYQDNPKISVRSHSKNKYFQFLFLYKSISKYLIRKKKVIQLLIFNYYFILRFIKKIFQYNP